MKKLGQALRMDRCRCFRSPFFYLACAMMLVFWIITDIQAITAPPDSGAVLDLFQQRSSFALFASLPFATVFCEDFRNRFLWYSVQRTGASAYAWSKIISAMIYTLLANLLSCMIYIALLRLRFPLMSYLPNIRVYASIAPYGELLLGSAPILYFICIAACESLFAGILGVTALTLSCLLPDFFVTLATPIILYYVIINAVTSGAASPYRIYITHSIDLGGPVISLLYAIGYAIIWMLIMGALFRHLVQRRLVHG